MRVDALVSFSEMLPVLQARQALHESTVIALGTANLKSADSRRIRRDLEKAANSPYRGRSSGTRLDLAAMNPVMARLAVQQMGFVVADG